MRHFIEILDESGNVVKTLEIDAAGVRVRPLPAPDPVTIELEGFRAGDMLPAGDYEVAILFRGQDNVSVTTDGEISVDTLHDMAKSAWMAGDTSDLGNEWQEVERMVIRVWEAL